MNFLPLIAALTLSSAFAAQPPQPTGAEERAGRESPGIMGERAKEGKAAESAAARKAVAGKRVTFQQVMADPDNIDLNYDFARTQIGDGDVKGAVATLERILMVNPGLHRVRLLYALALFRLDNLNEAARELDTLSKLSIPANLQSELEDLKRTVTRRRRTTHIDATLGAGFDYDSNRSATPSSEQLLFANQFIPIAPAHPDTSDTALIGLGNVEVTYDPGTQQGHEVFGGFGWYRQEQTLQDKLDLQVFSFNLGTALKFGANTLTPRVNWDQVYLSEEVFLERSSLAVRYDRKLSQRLALDFEARLADDMYSNTSEITRATDRSGPQWDLAFGLGFVATPVMRVHGGYTLTGKAANKETFIYNAYERHSVNTTVSYLLGRGMFLLVSGTMDIDRYDGPDPLIGVKVRDDITYRARLTFGTPLGFLHRFLKDFTFTQSYEYFRAESDITNYAYDNDKLSSLVTYKWGW